MTRFNPTRPALSRERILSEALALIESDGLDAFSTRRLAQRLGCEAMSLYHHHPSKAHLLDSLVDQVLGAMPLPDPSQRPADRLRQLAATWRHMARRHPRFYLWLALHRWNSATGVRFLGAVLGCFADAGLSREQSARAFRVVGYYLLGATLDETGGYAQGPSSLNPIPLDVLQREHPLVAQAGEFFVPEQFDRTFELGFEVLLRGLGLDSGTSPD
ncbi:MAG: TetR/AcrR family transcriptional regulator C-terminal domain-containing protein [Rubrivivax sp.]|nr:TetR/AcrR family transcriptional regulator C-terminal domain-containing protein [Rubrivivax sp.]